MSDTDNVSIQAIHNWLDFRWNGLGTYGWVEIGDNRVVADYVHLGLEMLTRSHDLSSIKTQDAYSVLRMECLASRVLRLPCLFVKRCSDDGDNRLFDDDDPNRKHYNRFAPRNEKARRPI